MSLSSAQTRGRPGVWIYTCMCVFLAVLGSMEDSVDG